jgi:hypothetical membrane protein
VSSEVRDEPAIRRLPFGAALWLCTLQFFLIETVVESRWRIHYDRGDYYISDLGALRCDLSGTRPVCSPWHPLMNASFVVQGVLIIGGALLLHQLWLLSSSRRSALSTTALLGTAGAGVALVGAAPEDTVPALHVLGAAANFAAGNVGLVMLCFVGRDVARRAGTPTLGVLAPVWAGLLGVVGLAALAALVAGSSLGLGAGGIERVIAYPLPAALPVVAVGVLVASRSERLSQRSYR